MQECASSNLPAALRSTKSPKSHTRIVSDYDPYREDYTEVCEDNDGEKKKFVVIDMAHTPPTAPYYKWPALVDRGSGDPACPLTWIKWGDDSTEADDPNDIDVDVPAVSPSIIFSPATPGQRTSSSTLSTFSADGCTAGAPMQCLPGFARFGL